MAKSRVTADSISAGIICGAATSWLANVADLGLLRPLQLNLWRLLTGKELLPIDLGYQVRWELTSFNRWWLVLLVTAGMTTYGAWAIPRGSQVTSAQHLIPIVSTWLLFAVLYQLYWIPTHWEGAADWISRLALSLLMAVVIGVGVRFCVQRAMAHFAQEVRK